MKKLLLAVAVASAFATSAFAQSAVTLYGNIDVGVAYSNSDSITGVETKSGVYSGLWQDSYIGFKGAENLGNGMKAIFTLEYAINAAQNSGIDTARETSLGLQTKVGTFKLGRVEAGDSIVRRTFDAMDQTSFSPIVTILGAERYLDSTVSYQGEYNGLTFGGGYSFDGSGLGAPATAAHGGPVDQEKLYSLNAGYSVGNLAVGYSYTNVNNLARTSVEGESHLVGASYKIGDLSVLGSYRQTESNDTYNIGARYAVTPNLRVDAGYSYIDGDNTDSYTNIYGVQAGYNLSKRTMAYVGYQYVDNNKSNFAALGNTFGTPAVSVSGDAKSYGVGAGLKHTF